MIHELRGAKLPVREPERYRSSRFGVIVELDQEGLVTITNGIAGPFRSFDSMRHAGRDNAIWTTADERKLLLKAGWHCI